LDGAEVGAALGVLGGGVPPGAFAGAACCGVTGFGAETPATLDPSPSFCNESASSLPVGSSPLSDWNFCIASIVLASHFPLGSPL